MRGWSGLRALGLIVLAAAFAAPEVASAVPSFSRQTGMPCSSCHTVFPQLTSFGRDFKRKGYVLATSEEGNTDRMKIDHIPPLSVMLQGSFTHVAETLPTTQNDDVTVPQQLSLFYGGRISSKMGAFVQLTYDGVEDHLGIDNTDVRFATEASNLVLGVTLNNAPTVSDLWNSTPAWGYPYASSSVAPGPAAGTLFDAFAQTTVGLGGYAAWNGWVHLEAAAYRSFPVGDAVPPDSTDTNVIAAVAPYWRAAVYHDDGKHSFEVGTFGLWAGLYPGGGQPLTGTRDEYTDVGVDGQYQYLGESNIVTVHARFIQEQRDLAASAALGLAAAAEGHLTSVQADATYYYERLIGGTVAFFDLAGNADADLYAPGSVDGSATGSPDSQGLIFQLSYVPWLNTKFLAQYVAYTRFNGGTTDYDGSGRDASGNDTFYVAAWLMF